LSCNNQDDIIIENIDAEIIEAMDAVKVPSVVACVVKDNKIEWEGTYGFADAGKTEPVTRESLYALQSISKLFLSVAVMQLWEEDLIDLEADINDYLPFDVRNPNYPDHKITSYMLMHHQSGLAWPVEADGIPDFHHFYYPDEEPPLISEWLPEYILPNGAQYRNTVWKDFAPGDKWLYSNIGTSLLALIVEKISGLDYREYCQMNILEPLEMNNSAFRFSNMDQQLLVTPFYNNNRPFSPHACRYYPIGMLYTNIEDFSHFAMMILNEGEYKGNSILKPATLNKMINSPTPGKGVSYLWWTSYGNRKGHRGAGTGYSTLSEWSIENDIAFFIFSGKVNDSVRPGGRIYDLVRYQSQKY
jgi:CubicO group peptidase (beta-lactamase class C family)